LLLLVLLPLPLPLPLGAGWKGAHLAIRLIHTFTHPLVKMMSLLRI
jgi:hypothetical protein